MDEINDRHAVTDEAFYRDYLVPNRPALIRGSCIGIDDWNAFKRWTKTDANGEITTNIDYLVKNYGDAEVFVTDCRSECMAKTPSTLGEFLENAFQDPEAKAYVKDWHMKLLFPNENIYNVPSIAKDDWLSPFFLQSNGDDFRFVYIGSNGSWTPLHADVFRSYSWSVNICGTKKWIFFPPEQEENLKDKWGTLIFDVRRVDENDYTNFQIAWQHRIEVTQLPGDLIFVPSNWFHQVLNDGPTISINHNWGLETNLTFMFQSLWHDWSECKERLEELKDEVRETWIKHNTENDNHNGWVIEWKTMVYQMFESHAGIKWMQFFDYIQFGMLKLQESNHEKRGVAQQHLLSIIDRVRQDDILREDFSEQIHVIKKMMDSRE